MRLNKYIALHLGLSRREADNYIEKGRVLINGIPVALGAPVKETDVVSVDGEEIAHQTDYQYLLLNKPAGYVCSRRAQGDAPTIYSILPQKLHHLKPVGRLDKDSSGLILLTNDGDFAHRMTHPSFHKQKTYHVALDHDLEPLHQQMISDYGITLEDGPSRLLLERRSQDNRTDWTVLMHEGRNRQIRRTFTAVGYTVTYLHRVQFGNYSLGDISLGSYDFVNMR